MASYGLRYIREFTNVQDSTCRLEFWQKDYIGTSQYILGSRDSFVLSKEIDDPFEPIQAQPATIELLTDEQTAFGINTFYSEDDEEWLVKFYLIPFGGIQREVFYQTTVRYIFFTHTDTDNYILIYDDGQPALKAGQTIEILAATYTITKVELDNGQYTLHVAETVLPRSIVDIYTQITVYDVIDDGLIYTGFLLHDESEDAFISYDHFIKLTATDNLGLLSDIDFDVACGDIYPYAHFTIAEYLQIILAQTGLQLPIQIFANIYETTTISRTTDPTATFADQIRLFSGSFADQNGKWQSCYDVLSAILKAFGCIICQRKGKWVIYRYGELRTLDNTPFAGTEFSYDLSSKTNVSLPNKPVLITDKRNTLTGGASNILSSVRPYKYVAWTFDYKQPAQLLKDEDLRDVGSLRGTSLSSDGKLRYTDYNFPGYFRHENSAPNGTTLDGSFIRVTTEIATDTETEREIITPFIDSTYKWLSFNPVEVSEGDVLDFSCQFKALSESSNVLRVNIRFELFFIDANGNTSLYVLSPFRGSNNIFGQYTWIFEGNTGAQNYKTFLGIPFDITDDITNWNGFDISGTIADGWKMPDFPVDGILVVSFNGTNNTSDGNNVAHRDVGIKDISLVIKNRINESYDVIGQTHTQTQQGVIKNADDQPITVDDSPRNTIAGTLFIDKLTHFNYFGYDAYMDKTKFWEAGIAQSKRLGQITSLDTKQAYSRLRNKLSCSFIFDDYVDILTTLQVQVLGSINFRFATINAINFANCTCEGVLVELWESGELVTGFTYEFEYLYEKS